MKRYALFAYSTYEALGGWDDFQGTYETVAEAERAGWESHRELFHVIDLETGETETRGGTRHSN